MNTPDLSRMAVCDCTQMPEAGPCEHNKTAEPPVDRDGKVIADVPWKFFDPNREQP